jgi:thiamine pyrophosphate-dependent acetolactate synthase large subunit-like protein
VLALASHIPSRQIGTGYFQETKPEALFTQASHYCETISHPSQTARVARGAIQAAVGKQGAAVIVFPGDILTEHSDGAVLPGVTVTGRPRPAPSEPEIAELAQRVQAAGKVTIFGGVGCTGARAEVLELAGRLNAPVGHSLRGKDVLQYDNPFDVGMTGLLGYGACYESLHDADPAGPGRCRPARCSRPAGSRHKGSRYPGRAPGDLLDAARAVFAHDGPALLDVVTTADALEVPSHITAREARDFALSLGKVVLTGGVGEVANLARLNVRNIPRP